MFKKALLSSLVSVFLTLSILTVSTAFGAPTENPPSGLTSPTFGGLTVNGNFTATGTTRLSTIQNGEATGLDTNKVLINDDVTVSGASNLNGNVVIGDAKTDSLSINPSTINLLSTDGFAEIHTQKGIKFTQGASNIAMYIKDSPAEIVLGYPVRSMANLDFSAPNIFLTGGISSRNDIYGRVQPVRIDTDLRIHGGLEGFLHLDGYNGLLINDNAKVVGELQAVNAVIPSIDVEGLDVTGNIKNSGINYSGAVYIQDPLTVNGALTATSVNATSVGRFYKTSWSTTASFSAGGSASTSVACDAGDIVIDCGFYSTPTSAPNANTTYISKIGPGNGTPDTLDGRTCYVTGFNPVIAGTVQVRATCFSPNG